MNRRLHSRTWPVFIVGIGSLLALLFLPGIAALRRTASVYLEIRRIQDAHRETQRSLSEIERQVYLISITVRDALLDSSSVTGAMYRRAFQERRQNVEQQLAILKRASVIGSRASVPKLEQELDLYFQAFQPVFEWTPAERSARATYFLREQQRPRRQSIIAIAEEIMHLTDAAYSKQLEQVNHSQVRFGDDIERVIGAAFLIGVLISAATVWRIEYLEDKAERHRIKTETAEDELRNLSTKLMHAQEEERRTLSRELHDEVGQILTAIRMGLGGLERLRSSPEELHQQVGEVKQLTEQALRSVRDLAVGLRPSVLDLGLVPAVQWQARQTSKYSGLPATVHPDGNLEDIPEEHRTCIYRIVQECLTNAVKHSGAKSVRIDLREADGILDVSVRDDGSGFRRQAPDGGGLGLVGMEERVRELGGSLKVESQPSAGTSVFVHLPIPGGAAVRHS